MNLRNIFTNIKVKADVPVFQKCFVFIPLRIGLICWGYINVMTALTFLIYGVIHLTSENFLIYYYEKYDGSYAYMFNVFVIVQVANIAFSILLATAGHKNNVKLLQIYYYFAMGKLLVCTITLTVIYIICHYINPIDYYYSVDKLWYYLFIENPAAEVIYIIVQLYVILLTRSFLLQLRDDQQNPAIPTVFQNNLYYESDEKYLIPECKEIKEDTTNSLSAIISQILEREQEKKTKDFTNANGPAIVEAAQVI